MASFTELVAQESTCKEQVNFLPEVVAIGQEIIENRRWFHANPELSFEEYKTAAKIAEILRSYGIEEVYEKVGRTGVVAVIRGKEAGPCVALRADIDALPLQETAEVEYRSQNAGVMHACGHDGHIAGLLAATKVLFNQRDQLRGTVKLFFQPAEEGYGGAREMIKEGCLEDGPFGPAVDFVYGLHLWSCTFTLYMCDYFTFDRLLNLSYYVIYALLCSFRAGQDRLPGGPHHGCI